MFWFVFGCVFVAYLLAPSDDIQSRLDDLESRFDERDDDSFF